MRVGFHGTFQPIADAVKLMAKEDILPSWADRRVYWLAPLAVFVPSFLIWVTLPVAQDVVIRNMDLGLFYITAISVLSVLGLVMAGWGSANKYAILGGLRAAGQLLSYEIPFIMSILAVAMLVQSLNLEDIVNAQSNVAYALVQPLGLFLFLTAGLAELGRTPFDIHHAESEVVGGPFVEYSGAHWAIFFLAEYVNTFTVAALTTLLFLGGWRWPAMPFDGALHSALSVAVVHGQVLRGHPVHILGQGHLPAPADRPAHGLRLEGAGAALLRQHRRHRRRALLRLAPLGADPAVSANIGRHLLRGHEEHGRKVRPGHRDGPSRQQPAGTGLTPFPPSTGKI